MENHNAYLLLADDHWRTYPPLGEAMTELRAAFRRIADDKGDDDANEEGRKRNSEAGGGGGGEEVNTSAYIRKSIMKHQRDNADSATPSSVKFRTGLVGDTSHNSSARKDHHHDKRLLERAFRHLGNALEDVTLQYYRRPLGHAGAEVGGSSSQGAAAVASQHDYLASGFVVQTMPTPSSAEEECPSSPPANEAALPTARPSQANIASDGLVAPSAAEAASALHLSINDDHDHGVAEEKRGDKDHTAVEEEILSAHAISAGKVVDGKEAADGRPPRAQYTSIHQQRPSTVSQQASAARRAIHVDDFLPLLPKGHIEVRLLTSLSTTDADEEGSAEKAEGEGLPHHRIVRWSVPLSLLLTAKAPPSSLSAAVEETAHPPHARPSRLPPLTVQGGTSLHHGEHALDGTLPPSASSSFLEERGIEGVINSTMLFLRTADESVNKRKKGGGAQASPSSAAEVSAEEFRYALGKGAIHSQYSYSLDVFVSATTAAASGPTASSPFLSSSASVARLALISRLPVEKLPQVVHSVLLYGLSSAAEITPTRHPQTDGNNSVPSSSSRRRAILNTLEKDGHASIAFVLPDDVALLPSALLLGAASMYSLRHHRPSPHSLLLPPSSSPLQPSGPLSFSLQGGRGERSSLSNSASHLPPLKFARTHTPTPLGGDAARRSLSTTPPPPRSNSPPSPAHANSPQRSTPHRRGGGGGGGGGRVGVRKGVAGMPDYTALNYGGRAGKAPNALTSKVPANTSFMLAARRRLSDSPTEE